MRVAMYYRNDDDRLEEMPTPEIGPGEVLIRIMASGICGSDVLEWYRIKTAPRVLGHEIAGEIVQVKKGVGSRFLSSGAGNPPKGETEKRDPTPFSWQVGDRVFATHHVPCNTCRYCLAGHHTACDTLHHTNFDPGGFAEFVRVPALNVDRGMLHLPDDVSFEAGTFIEPLACVLRGQRLMGIEPGRTVLVLGSGISGLLHIMCAAPVARVIATDIRPYRLEAARKAGADAVIDAADDVPARVRDLNDGHLAERVIVCTGAMPAMRQALLSVDRGGKVMFFAVPPPGDDVPVDMNALWRNEVTLMTSYGGAPADLARALAMIAAGRVPVEDLITHRLPLAETGRGFRLVADADESVKVIINPQD